MTEIENLIELFLEGGIKNMKRLEVLDLSYNSLDSLPKEIGELKNLKEFKRIVS